MPKMAQNAHTAGDTANHVRATNVDGMRVPSHGKGWLKPFPPGNNANPSGKPKTLKEVQKLARNRSMDALTALIGVYTLPNGKLDRTADGKTVVAAATAVLKWAYGEPPPFNPNEHKSELRIDLEGVSLAERKRTLEVLQNLKMVASDTVEDDGNPGPDFDASRFAEPVTIEGDVVEEPAPRRRAAAAAPVVEAPVPPPPVVKRKAGRPLGSKNKKRKRVQRPPQKA